LQLNGRKAREKKGENRTPENGLFQTKARGGQEKIRRSNNVKKRIVPIKGGEKTGRRRTTR